MGNLCVWDGNYWWLTPPADMAYNLSNPTPSSKQWDCWLVGSG